MIMPIRTGLNDVSSYVRRTAVMGVAKVHAIDPNVVRGDSRLALYEFFVRNSFHRI